MRDARAIESQMMMMTLLGIKPAYYDTVASVV
jgi:hypothetical protein